MKNVLYFHGFASSSGSAKIVALKPLLAPAGVELETPDLNAPDFEHLDWKAIVERALDATRHRPPDAIVGSSLGALVALEIVRRGARAPLVLIAPALGIGARWLLRLPQGDPITVFNHALAADAKIHRRFFEQMNEVDADRDPPSVPVTVIMGRRDDTVPFELVESRWQEWAEKGIQPGSRFIDLPDGDHGLTAYADLIAVEIARAAGSPRIGSHGPQ
jgi:pimeloyl-ACP methyl ester carboxylesterase